MLHTILFVCFAVIGLFGAFFAWIGQEIEGEGALIFLGMAIVALIVAFVGFYSIGELTHVVEAM